jgi:tripartite-type tricarboxylate transporter receptor subunit TctC
MRQVKRHVVSVFTAALLVCGHAVSAQTDRGSAVSYPTRPIRIVVPFAAGGPSDVGARTLAQRMSQNWRQTIVVDNRIGASGIIGADIVARSAPDGYTLLMAQVGDAISMSLYSKLPYNFIRDFAPITLVGQTPFILVAHPSVPVKTVQELIALVKAKPRSLSFGSAGTGVASHLAGELFKTAAGIDIVHVPYKGQAPATTALLGGEIAYMFNNPITALPHIRTGKMRALGVSTAARFSGLPEVPTVAESGLPGFAVGFWLGPLAPAGTPRAVIDKLNAEMVGILRTPEIVERLSPMGLEILATSPDEFARVIEADAAKWAKVVKDAGIKAD